MGGLVRREAGVEIARRRRGRARARRDEPRGDARGRDGRCSVVVRSGRDRGFAAVGAARWAFLGLHHDAVTGTCPADVADDVFDAANRAEADARSAVARLAAAALECEAFLEEGGRDAEGSEGFVGGFEGGASDPVLAIRAGDVLAARNPSSLASRRAEFRARADPNEPPVVIVDARTGERLRSQREASDETIVVFAVENVPAAGLVALEVVPLGDRAAPVTPVAVTPASLGVEFERRGVHLTRDRVRLSLASYASPRDEHFGDGPYVTRSSAWHVAPACVGGAAAYLAANATLFGMITFTFGSAFGGAAAGRDASSGAVAAGRGTTTTRAGSIPLGGSRGSVVAASASVQSVQKAHRRANRGDAWGSFSAWLATTTPRAGSNSTGLVGGSTRSSSRPRALGWLRSLGRSRRRRRRARRRARRCVLGAAAGGICLAFPFRSPPTPPPRRGARRGLSFDATGRDASTRARGGLFFFSDGVDFFSVGSPYSTVGSSITRFCVAAAIGAAFAAAIWCPDVVSDAAFRSLVRDGYRRGAVLGAFAAVSLRAYGLYVKSYSTPRRYDASRRLAKDGFARGDETKTPRAQRTLLPLRTLLRRTLTLLIALSTLVASATPPWLVDVVGFANGSLFAATAFPRMTGREASLVAGSASCASGPLFAECVARFGGGDGSHDADATVTLRFRAGEPTDARWVLRRVPGVDAEAVVRAERTARNGKKRGLLASVFFAARRFWREDASLVLDDGFGAETAFAPSLARVSIPANTRPSGSFVAVGYPRGASGAFGDGSFGLAIEGAATSATLVGGAVAQIGARRDATSDDGHGLGAHLSKRPGRDLRRQTRWGATGDPSGVLAENAEKTHEEEGKRGSARGQRARGSERARALSGGRHGDVVAFGRALTRRFWFNGTETAPRDAPDRVRGEARARARVGDVPLEFEARMKYCAALGWSSARAGVDARNPGRTRAGPRDRASSASRCLRDARGQRRRFGRCVFTTFRT